MSGPFEVPLGRREEAPPAAHEIQVVVVARPDPPLPQLQIVPVGGVDLGTAADFIRKGAVALGVGSALVNQKLLDAGDMAELTRRAEAFVAEVKKGRG